MLRIIPPFNTAANHLSGCSGHLRSVMAEPGPQFLVMLCVGLLLRIAAFGDPNIYVDESFYLLVGHEMHHGAIPYVDIWDRKPLGLFLIYWIFAFFGDGVLAYQIGAWIFASYTAFIIARIAGRWAPPAGSLIAGTIYLATLGVILGQGGQSPVFYNAFVATGALFTIQFVTDGAPAWKLYASMLLCGLAITFKQSACFEGIFFGLYAALHHHEWRKAILQVALGAAPFTVIAGWYAYMGHWTAFEYAMITTNTLRPFMSYSRLVQNGTHLLILIAPLLGLTLYSFLFTRNFPGRFFSLWIGAATVGFLSVPYLIEHYALPMLVPLSAVAAPVVSRKPVGAFLVAGVIANALMITAPLDFRSHRESKREFARMAKLIGPLGSNGRLLVFKGPPLLYTATGTHPMSRLAFPAHLSNDFEKNTSPRKPGPELDRLVQARPDAIVVLNKPGLPPDPHAYQRMIRYAETHCRAAVPATVYLPYAQRETHLVYAGCGISPRARDGGAGV